MREIHYRNSFYKPSDLLKFNRASPWDSEINHLYLETVATVTKSVKTLHFMQNSKSSSQRPEGAPNTEMNRSDTNTTILEMTKFENQHVELKDSPTQSGKQRRKTEMPVIEPLSLEPDVFDRSPHHNSVPR